MRREHRWFSVIFIVVLMLMVLSVSIAVPLVCRWFYYIHIELLELPQKTGFTAAEIRDAFDEMMDFCIYGKPFGTGVLRWSEDGMRHFADCARLFRLDFAVMFFSLAVLGICLWLRRHKVRPAPVAGMPPAFWAGTVLLGSFVLIAGLAALDFDRAFTVFHRLFFPGQENWLFDPALDEIILILPETFFRNCAILIIAVLFFLCAVLIFIGCAEKHMRRTDDAS